VIFRALTPTPEFAEALPANTLYRGNNPQGTLYRTSADGKTAQIRALDFYGDPFWTHYGSAKRLSEVEGIDFSHPVPKEDIIYRIGNTEYRWDGDVRMVKASGGWTISAPTSNEGLIPVRLRSEDPQS